MAKLDLYIRHNSDGARLSVYLDKEARKMLLAALMSPDTEAMTTEATLELSVLPDWVTDDEPQHLRIPVSSISFTAVDEVEDFGD